MPINKEPATPPMIGKIGPYTVFVTPPPTPKPSSEPSPVSVSEIPKRNNVSPPIQSPVAKSAPPVLPPPVQYEKSASAYDSKFGFFWDAVAKVQNAHSSLDDYVARWFGLNQSKYQWALDDYYEKKGVTSRTLVVQFRNYTGFIQGEKKSIIKEQELDWKIKNMLMQKLTTYLPNHKGCNMLVRQDFTIFLMICYVYTSKHHIKFSGWIDS